jgi:hypothetical protein
MKIIQRGAPSSQLRRRFELVSKPAVCRDCSEPILWASTISGKKMPLNPQPKPAPFGKFTVAFRPATKELIARIPHGEDAQGAELYECHLETCPGERAAEMRKNRQPQWGAANE